MMQDLISESIDNFFSQNGIYPEKIIIDEKSYVQLLRDINAMNTMFGGERFTEISEYKNIKIEVEKDITDWILVAPEQH